MLAVTDLQEVKDEFERYQRRLRRSTSEAVEAIKVWAMISCAVVT